MRTLVIFDSSKNFVSRKKRYISAGDDVYLFPMSVNKAASDRVLDAVKDAGAKAEVIATGRLINDSAEYLRSKYIEFIGELPGRVSVGGKNLKELFAVDDTASLWWYSLVAEKSNFKSEAFNEIVRFYSIAETIKEERIEKVLYGCVDYILQKELLKYFKAQSISSEIIVSRPARETARNILKSGALVYFKNIALLFAGGLKLFLSMYRRKKRIGNSHGIDTANSRLIILNYYPVIEIKQAENGVFISTHYKYLQEALESKKEEILWVSLYVQHFSVSFDVAVRYVEKFIKNGYKIVFIDNFCPTREYWKALLLMLGSGFRLLRYEKEIRKASDFEGYNVYGFLKNDWYSSFAGIVGYSGLLYYFAFKNLLSKVKCRICVYPFEMQPWERALIDARNSLGLKTPVFAHQPAGMSRMSLNYFTCPAEVRRAGRYSMPEPDKLLCDGSITEGYMRESGRRPERLEIVEGINYYHLRSSLSDRVREKKDEVLILLSQHQKESVSLIAAAYEAFRDCGNIPVFIRPHPYLNLRETRRLLINTADNMPFPIAEGAIDDLLSRTRIVIAGETTASIEALAHGCVLINIDSPDWINMSPLKNMECPVVRTVRSPQELRQAATDILNKKYDPELNFTEGGKIVESFFHLNKESDVPERFMNLLLKES